jgi:alkanesulfonate monooxygenase SsuD/methylene tetrahydromethanopterin reductase-like flavin-dependent oxidoreductase (luciferase family)
VIKKLATYPVEHHIVGSPETCAERVREYQHEAGVNYILRNMAYDNMPHDRHLASMRRFAEHAIPRFTTEPAVAGRR